MKAAAIAVLLLLSACSPPDEPHAPARPAREAEAKSADRPPRSRSGKSLRFFVTSVGTDGSGNLGGLSGADAHCQSLARAAGAGDLTWRAYLSAGPEEGRPAVHARDRIGRGPWYNAKGELVARDLDELHSDRNGITRQTALTEHGELSQKSHDILTGSDELGRLALSGGTPATCSNWTSSNRGIARIGHSDRMDSETFHNPRFKRWLGSWNAEHDTIGCGAEELRRTGGSGQIYCFASDVFEPLSEPSAVEAAGFMRGINVNHWIGDNLPESMMRDAGYGAGWFDEEDVRWIASQGFDHIRMWVDGHRWIAKDGELEAAALEPFERLLAWASAEKLGVVLAMHSTPGFRASLRGEPPPVGAGSPFTDADTRGDAAYLWWLVARRYAWRGDDLRFELLVRPEAPSAAALEAFQREALSAIRRTSPDRIVYLSPHDDGRGREAAADLFDRRTGLSLSFWEPESFTYQIDPRAPVVVFPSKAPGRGAPVSEALVASRVDALASGVGIESPQPIYVSEFGVAKRADDESARRYLKTVRAAFERQGFAWAVYDYHTAFAARDRAGGPTRVIDGLSLGRAR